MTAIAPKTSRDLLQRPKLPGLWACNACRAFSGSSVRLSGHNRWSTIKHDKAKNDKNKSKERQLISKDIRNATRMFGPDPKYNPRLTLALTNAKRAEIPKPVIEAAIDRGQGISKGEAFEQVTIEAILPPSVAVVIECETDAKARLLQDIRYVIKNSGGSVTPTTYLFERKGRVVFEKKDGLDPDEYLDQAIEAGATDLSVDESGRLVMFSEPNKTKGVGETLSKLAGVNVEEQEIFWDPIKDTLVSVEDEEHARKLEETLNTIREDPSVQDIYMNTVQNF